MLVLARGTPNTYYYASSLWWPSFWRASRSCSQDGCCIAWRPFLVYIPVDRHHCRSGEGSWAFPDRRPLPSAQGACAGAFCFFSSVLPLLLDIGYHASMVWSTIESWWFRWGINASLCRCPPWSWCFISCVHRLQLQTVGEEHPALKFICYVYRR